MNDYELPELQDGWEWQSGERGNDYYTTNFGTEYEMGGGLAGKHGLGGYTGQVFWDEGGDHHVEIIPVVRFDGDDPVYDYPVVTETFETEKEAHEAVPELIENL